MGQTYNITMKHFNGVDYDTLLPDTRKIQTSGVYMGNGVMMSDGGQDIVLGFKPKFVIITRGWLDPTFNPRQFYVAGEASENGQQLFIELKDNGFRVGKTTESLVDQVQHVNFVMELNNANTLCSYIAFQ